MNNLYEILEVSPEATQKEIKQAYRRLVKQFHPDSQCSTADHEKIVLVNAAYEILGDSEHRLLYDQKEPLNRSQRREWAQKEYKKNRQKDKNEQTEVNQWQQEIYTPIERLILQIVKSLNRQVDYLAADPFDDQLMEEFQDYLSGCQISLEKAKSLFMSRPNPYKLAKVAASLYYCLNQIADGLEEFERFTLSYDDLALHQGQELFRLAQEFILEAQRHLQYVTV